MKKIRRDRAVDPKTKRFKALQESEATLAAFEQHHSMGPERSFDIKVRQANSVSALVDDLLAYRDERKRQHKLRLREWKARHRAYKQGKGEDPGPKPLPFTFIKDVSDLVTIVKLHLSLLGEGTDTTKRVVKKNDDRVEELIKTDPNLRKMLADAWRKVHMTVLPGGKNDDDDGRGQ